MSKRDEQKVVVVKRPKSEADSCLQGCAVVILVFAALIFCVAYGLF